MLKQECFGDSTHHCFDIDQRSRLVKRLNVQDWLSPCRCKMRKRFFNRISFRNHSDWLKHGWTRSYLRHTDTRTPRKAFLFYCPCISLLDSNLHEPGRNDHLNSTAMCRTSVKVSFKFTLLLGQSSWDPIFLHTMSCKMFCLKWKVSPRLSMTQSRQTKHCPTENIVAESEIP